MDSSYTSPTTKPLYKGTQIVWYIFGIVEALLALRVVLKLLGANIGAGFTNVIYEITAPLVAPFISVFNPARMGNNTLEWSTFIAMLAYWLLAVAIIRLFLMSRTVSTPEAAEKLKEKDT